MDIEDAICVLKQNISHAERDMYKTSVYYEPESAKREIEALELAIFALKTQVAKKLKR